VSEPSPAAAIGELPLARPFIAPEELAARAGHAELLRLGANESAFGPPPAALAAMRDDLARVSWYGDPESMHLRTALARKHGCSVDNLVVGAGIDDLLGLAVRGYLAPGDASVCVLGTYPTYAYHVAGYGGRLVTVPYARNGSIPLDALARAARDCAARVVYVANPDNPSGSFAGRAALQAFLDDLPPQALLVLDEAYADFVEAAELLPERIEPRIVRMRTFSKAYGLAGLRIAYALAAPAVIETFGKIRLQYGVNRLAQTAALAALKDGGPFVAEVVREVERGRDEYRALGRERGLPTLASSANFVNFDLESRARAEALVAALLARAVFVRKPGAPPLDRCIRVTVGTAQERARFGQALAAALVDLDAPAAV